MTAATATAARTTQAARAIDAATDRDGYLTVAQLAEVTGRTPRNLRRAFRKAGNGTGHGSIYLVPVTEAKLHV